MVSCVLRSCCGLRPRWALPKPEETEECPLAIYHCHISIIKRSTGRSAVAAAAYRSGERIVNDWDGMTHDYTRKRGIVHAEILLPSHAPPEYADRSTLWNAVEKVESGGKAQLAREINVALPTELAKSAQVQLVREYCKTQFADVGMCADFAIHDTGGGNPHAHILLTMRPFKADGQWDAKQRKQYVLDDRGKKLYDKTKRQYQCRSVPTTDWNEHSKAEVWREAWASAVNRALEKEQCAERIDHRSYERQGVDKIPTVHMGVAATQMERRGIRTQKGDYNREIAEQNRLLKEIKARVTRLYNWSKEQIADDEKPSILEMMKTASEPASQSRYAKARAVKTMARLVNFMVDNNVYSMDALFAKIGTMQKDYYALRGEIAGTERKLKTMQDRLDVWRQYEQNRPVRKKLDRLPESKRAAFAEDHSGELILLDRAVQQLDEWKASGERITPKHWRADADMLAAQRDALYTKMRSMRDSVKAAEELRKAAATLMRPDEQRKKERSEAKKDKDIDR